MCDHCGCRQVEPIGELMDEHDALTVEGDDLRRALADGDRTRAAELWHRLVGHVDEHVRKEEVGLFPVSVVSLGARGWDRGEDARRVRPSWLATGRA